MRRAALAVLLLSLAASASAALAEVRFAVAPPDAVAPLIMPPSAVGLQAMSWLNNCAYAPRALDALGRGEFGAVYAHPADPALVVKVAADGFGGIVARSARERELDALDEAESSRRLADAGAGPKLIAVTRVRHRLQPLLDRAAAFFRVPAPDWSRPALVKERVHGRTLADLKRDGALTDAHRDMVARLRGRLARAGLRAGDFHDDNVMIGATASDPAPRALLVDAGLVRSLP
jgi:hypothetical protein